VGDEDKRYDDETQQHGENNLKVLLKVALNPGDHGRKNGNGRWRPGRGKG